MNNSPITLGQIQVEAGQPERNLERAIQTIRATPEGGMIVLPEMALPGYMIGDMWLRDSYIRACREMNGDILQASKESQVTVIWGNIDFDPTKKNEDGSIRKYNAAYIASNGEMLGVRYKTLLPNYRMFDDKRYFTSLKQLAEEEGISLENYYKPIDVVINGVKQRVSILICEDIWNINNDYTIDPVMLTRKHNPDIIAVCSASPFGLDKASFRRRLLARQSQGTRLVYVNPIGIQNNGKNIFAFDGGSAEYDNGEFVQGIEDFTTDRVIKTLWISQKRRDSFEKWGPEWGVWSNTMNEEAEFWGWISSFSEIPEISQIYNTLIYTIREFVRGFSDKKVVIGLSGGIDSGVVAALLVEALGPDRVIAVNMPSEFNSDTTKNLAKELAANLGIEYKISPIQTIVDEEIRVIAETTGKQPSSFDIENIQARTRGIRLAGIAANQNAIFTNNGNKDEFATGYATLYGDVNGAIALIGDLRKTQVFALARYINKRTEKEMIPTGMIEMKPSAELSPSQNPENGGGDPFEYEFLGRLEQAFIEKKKTPEDILEMYLNDSLASFLSIEKPIAEIFPTPETFIGEIEKIWKLLFGSYFKRVQAPPIVTLSKASFGFDYREAQNGVYFTRKYGEMKRKILAK